MLPANLSSPSRWPAALKALVVGAVLVAMPCLALAPAFGNNAFLFGTDTVAHDYIMAEYVWARSVVGRGEWPLWCPHMFSGLPMVGSYAACPFHPVAWLQGFLSTNAGFTAQYAATLALGGLSMAFLARRLGLGWILALVAGLAFESSGHFLTLIHAGHLQKMLAIATAPAALGVALGLGQFGPRRNWSTLAIISGLGAALALQLLAGHPQIFYATALLCSAVTAPWGTLRPGRIMRHTGVAAKSTAQRAAVWSVAVIVALLVSGPQTFPGAMEMSSVSNRATGVTFEEATQTSYPPLELLEYVIPSVFGDSRRDAPVKYFGAWGERIVSDYLGVSLILLALAGFAALWRNQALPHRFRHPRRLAILLALGIGFSIVIGLGRYTPVYLVLWAVVPGFSSFRSPGTFMFVATMLTVVLAAIGAHALAHRASCADRVVKRSAMALGAMAGMGLVASALGLWENLGFQLDIATPDEARRWLAWRHVAAVGAELAAAAGLVAVIFTVPSAKRWALRGLGALVLTTLVLHNGRYVRFESLPPFRAYLHQSIYRTAQSSLLPGEAPRVLDTSELITAPVAQEIGTPAGYHPVVLERYQLVQSNLGLGSEGLARLFAINFVKTPTSAAPAGGPWVQAGVQSVPSNAVLWRRATPYPSWIQQGIVQTVAHESAALRQVVDNATNPAAIDRALVVVTDERLQNVPLLDLGLQDARGVSLVRESPHRLHVSLAPPARPSLLALAQPFAPGWQAQDPLGRPVPILPVNLAQLGIVVPPGVSEVHLRYDPFSFRLGLFAALATLMVGTVIGLSRVRWPE